jgi:hypothetical protein
VLPFIWDESGGRWYTAAEGDAMQCNDTHKGRERVRVTNVTKKVLLIVILVIAALSLTSCIYMLGKVPYTMGRVTAAWSVKIDGQHGGERPEGPPRTSIRSAVG